MLPGAGLAMTLPLFIPARIWPRALLIRGISMVQVFPLEPRVDPQVFGEPAKVSGSLPT